MKPITKFFAVLLLSFIGTIAVADSPVPPFDFATGGGIDPTNLIVNFDIPIIKKPGLLPFELNLHYNNAIWVTGIKVPAWSIPGSVTFGWSIPKHGVAGSIDSTTSTQLDCQTGNQITKHSLISYTSNNGFNHRFSGAFWSTNTCGFATSLISYSTDGYKFDSSRGVIDSGGTLYSASTGGIFGTYDKVTDVHGNHINGFVDTLGNTVVTLTGSGNVSSPYVYTYTLADGSSATTTIHYANTPFTINSNFNCTGDPDTGYGIQPQVSDVTYNDGTAYRFTYNNSDARIKQITLPTGGTIVYNYPGINHGVDCANTDQNSTAQNISLNVTVSDGVTPSTTTYTKTKVNNTEWLVTINDQLLDVTKTYTQQVSTYDIQTARSQHFLPTETLYYDNASNLLKTVDTCYDGAAIPCLTTLASNQPLQIDTQTTLPGVAPFKRRVVLNTFLLPTDVKEYGFGPTLVYETAITYGLSYPNCAAIGNDIVNRPCHVTKTDAASGSILAETRYVNDTQGNTTSTSQLVGGTTFLTSSALYNANGTVSQETDAAENTTVYTSSACNSAFPTSVSLPLNLSTSQTWNCVGGVPLSATDVNGKITSVSYTTNGADSFWRPKSATDELGNQTNFAYTPNSFIANMWFNNQTSAVGTRVTLDSLGRPYIFQRPQSPSSANYDTVSKTFDALGRVSSVSIPCVKTVGVACAISPGTTQTYDALNRPLITTDAGNGTLTLSYVKNDVLYSLGPAPAGETAKQHQYESDGLGRLTSVCEINTISGSGACGQAQAKNGYVTSYAYAANTRTITQGVQTRSYAYDGLGRMTSETNPESGTLQYVWDTGSGSPGAACVNGPYAGDLNKTYDANGITTCNEYDALHRLVSVYYYGPTSTPSKHLQYDLTSGGGHTLTNTKGRLAQAYTCVPGVPSCVGNILVEDQFSYSPRGELLDTWFTTPQSGGEYHVGTTYWANGALNTLTGPGLPTFTYNADGEGRPTTVSATGGGVNPVTATTYNTRSQVTAVTFGSLDSAAFTFDNNTGLMTKYQETINGSAASGTLTWNANGTLQKNVIVDPFNSANAQTCTYLHDDLGRVGTPVGSSANSVDCGTTTWQQKFTYDRYGNITKSGSLNWSPGYDPATNHITLGGSIYDGNGNLTYDLFHHYTWDGNGKLITVDNVPGTANLTYDALGNQVEKNVGGVYTQYVYASDRKLAQMNGQTLTKAYVPLPGGTQALYAPNLGRYRIPDWLGSIRIESKSDRTWVWSGALAPFGERYAEAGVTSSHTFTAGHNQDTAPDLYDAPAREDHPSQGRWISPDPAGLSAVSFTNPQTWNRYAYVLNNPVTQIDPLGLCGRGGDNSNAAGCYEYNKADSWPWDSTDSIDRAAGKFDVAFPIPTVVLGTAVIGNCSFPCLSPRPPQELSANIIYDSMANNGEGLTDAQKKSFNEMLDHAKKELAGMGIDLQVSVTPGSLTVDARGNAQVVGAHRGSLNIIASDKTITGKNEIGFDASTGLYVTNINMHHIWAGNFYPFYQNSVEHELAHIVLGHVYIKNPSTWQRFIKEFSADTATFGNRWGLSHSFSNGLDHLFSDVP
jgi:RHS repeat-associated protein